MPKSTPKKEKEIVWKKGVNRILFPLLPEIEGEMIRHVRKIAQNYKLPKYRKIGIERIFYLGKDPFDITQVFIER